ncbi:cytochrome P450 [Lasiosphaeria ovina]|uniref:Cytochrome P450 n=1 Tax=Lasiosphaeria ovina TaxID=92902 RepID=A0AAE0MZ49_9PEZI|nr:cytochrome P450 [Lasiosphaeria ovina]
MKGAKPPPGPKGWPFIGNALELATSNGNLIPIFNKWAKQYGPIVQFGLPGETHAVLSDDRIANELFVKRETWRRERKLIHTAVSITTNTKCQGFMAEEATLTLNDVLKTPSYFSNHFLRYSYGVLTRSILGFRVVSADDAFYPSNLFPFLRVLPKWLMPSLGKLKVLRKGIVEEQAELRCDIEKSIAAGSAPGNSVYRHFLENRSEYAVTDLEAAYTFNSMIGGGTRSPQNALLTFVDAVIGPDRLPTFDDIPQLPVVRAIVKEGIRYRTIMAELGIPHRLDRTTCLRANSSPRPFNPARWLDPAYATTNREPLTIYPNCQNFTPFGYGRRACPGYDFAERTFVIIRQARRETINRGPLSPPSEVLRLLSKERKQNPPKPEPPPQQKAADEAVTADSLTSASTSDSPKSDKLCWVCQRVNTSDGDSCNDCMTGTMFEG